MPPREGPQTAAQIVSVLEHVSARLRTVECLHAGAVAVLTAALAFLSVRLSGGSFQWSAMVAAAIAVVGFIWRFAARRSAWTLPSAAQVLERVTPSSRNVVITAEELLRHPDRARPELRDRIFEHAGRATDRLDVRTAVPVRRELALVAIACLVAATIAYAAPDRGTTRLASSGATSQAIAPGSNRPSLSATITPPPYTGASPITIDDADRIDALEGSRVQLVLRGASSWQVRFGSKPLEVRPGDRTERVDFTASQSGYLALEPSGGNVGELRRLVPVVVTPDRAPTIRIDAPGKDLLLPNAKALVTVAASAADDYGLASLDLRYTKITGSGEQFEFKEGSIPLRISRSDARSWKADAELAIARLGLTPGDSLVYRVVGRDLRPGDAGLASSDTYFVEVAGPGQVALEGFELPPDRERYALSQQMIVLKLERLRARERSIDRATLEAEVANIAAEQRAVRANFIFLTGGTVEDEEEEAEHSHEIQEGRLENTARREIAVAIQHMGRTEQGLAAVNTGAALPPARAAVEALQRAFGRNRYFLRTVPVRSRVDPSRRLTGNIQEAVDWRRELFPPSEDGVDDRTRRLLARVIELSPEILNRTLPQAAMTAIAEEAISIDAASAEWQAIAKNLLLLRDQTESAVKDRKPLLDQTSGAIAVILRKRANALTPRNSAADALRSAFQDARDRK